MGERLWVDTARGTAGVGLRSLDLSRQAVLVLAALSERSGRVVTRQQLAQRAELTHLSRRRCDQLLLDVRRALGPSVVRNVRGRGWILAVEEHDQVPPP
jgi:DNA-binding response OmpR family regulator